ncbi:MAG: phage holin family protein [Candidatus Binatia bacterium]
MADGDGRGDERSSSPSNSFKALVAAISSAIHTRLELFAAELDEERERLKQALLLTLLLFFGLSLGFILLNIFVVALLWAQGWILAIGGLAALYLGVGIVAGALLRRAILTRPGLFPVTLAELGKDRDRLKASSRE